MEWEDVGVVYRLLRGRIKDNLKRNGTASFWANGYRPNSVGSDEKTEVMTPDIISIDIGDGLLNGGKK